MKKSTKILFHRICLVTQVFLIYVYNDAIVWNGNFIAKFCTLWRVLRVRDVLDAKSGIEKELMIIN